MSQDGCGALLFGTDGVRGPANAFLTPELALRLGRAGGWVLSQPGVPSRVLVGRDPRRSGDMLVDALSAGLMSVGVDVDDAGVCPTPGIAYLAATGGYSGAAVVSASHNPANDNGIKFFGPQGGKLNEAQEDAIEAALHAPDDRLPRRTGRGIGRRIAHMELPRQYARFVAKTARLRFDGIRVVLDCAHGATAGVAGDVFSSLGAAVDLIGAAPDGDNINDGVGSTHPDALSRTVLERNADVGFAFDGDGDRVVAVDGQGGVVDGDGILALCGLDLLRRGDLPGKAIVATVMSNLGLDDIMALEGGRVVRTPVGDRHVAAAMREHGIILGGEQAGHIIFMRHNPTGDGMVTAVQMLDILVASGVSLGEAVRPFHWYPQEHRVVRFRDRTAAGRALAVDDVRAAIADAESALGGHGRVVVRASGTEPVVRILVEAPTVGAARTAAGRLEEVIGQQSR